MEGPVDERVEDVDCSDPARLTAYQRKAKHDRRVQILVKANNIYIDWYSKGRRGPETQLLRPKHASVLNLSGSRATLELVYGEGPVFSKSKHPLGRLINGVIRSRCTKTLGKHPC